MLWKSGVACLEHEIVEVRNRVLPCFPPADVFVQTGDGHGLAVSPVVGRFQEFPDGEARLLEVRFHGETDDAHVMAPPLMGYHVGKNQVVWVLSAIRTCTWMTFST